MAAQPNENTAGSEPPQRENVRQGQDGNRKSQITEHGLEKDASHKNNSASATSGIKSTENQVASRQPDMPAPHHQQSGQQVAPHNQQVQDQGKGAPSVRLDMDLDVEIELKAKIKGDLELSVLYVFPFLYLNWLLGIDSNPGTVTKRVEWVNYLGMGNDVTSSMEVMVLYTQLAKYLSCLRSHELRAHVVHRYVIRLTCMISSGSAVSFWQFSLIF